MSGFPEGPRRAGDGRVASAGDDGFAGGDKRFAFAVERVVERFGELFADHGLTPIAGRILGWLLLCEPPEQTADELARAAGASRASVSTEVRRLMRTGVVEEIAPAGDRRRRYRAVSEGWTEMARGRIHGIRAFRALAEEGAALLEARDADPGRAARVRRMREWYAFLEEEYPALIARWEARREDEDR